MIDNHESITAKLCAFVRAWHSNKARTKVYDDYLAFDMMGKEEYDEVYDFIRRGFSQDNSPFSKEDTEAIITEYLAPIPLSRIHFSESRLAKFSDKYGRIQYVICGAGSDTFSFRNGNKNIEIYELDHPDTQRYKLDKIKALEWNIPQNVHFVPIDFEKERIEDRLTWAGFDLTIPTFFSILGVTYYLTLPVFTDTLKQIGNISVNNSVVVFDYPHKTGDFPQRVHRLEQITKDLGEVMQGGYDYGEISRALYSLGFQIDTYLNPQDTQLKYFSNRSDGLHAYENVSLISAEYTGGFVYE